MSQVNIWSDLFLFRHSHHIFSHHFQRKKLLFFLFICGQAYFFVVVQWQTENVVGANCRPESTCKAQAYYISFSFMILMRTNESGIC